MHDGPAPARSSIRQGTLHLPTRGDVLCTTVGAGKRSIDSGLTAGPLRARSWIARGEARPVQRAFV